MGGLVRRDDPDRGADGTTLIRGRVADQAALHGLLTRLRDLGLPLLSVVQVGGAGMTDSAAGPDGRSDLPGSWPVPVALVALSVIPVVAGTLRIVQLAGGPELMPADDRFDRLPVAIVVHIVGAAGYALVGVLQFVPRFRRRHWAWHRRAGRVLAVAGLLVAGSALWLTLFYEPKPGTGDLLYLFRLVFASAMAASLVLGVRRDPAPRRTRAPSVDDPRVRHRRSPPARRRSPKASAVRCSGSARCAVTSPRARRGSSTSRWPNGLSASHPDDGYP